MYCSTQNEACNAITYEKDSLDCSMWLLDLMYCNHPEFTSNFEKQDGQDDQLIDIFHGADLMDIQCPPQGKYSVFGLPILPHGLQSRSLTLLVFKS